MLSDHHKIKSLGYADIVEVLSTRYQISLAEAAEVVKDLTFSEYNALLEASADIPSPSGQATISPQPSTGTSSGKDASVQWAGKGTPVQQGMAVGIKDQQTGLVTPHQVTKTDGQGGVTVTDPKTGQAATYNEQDLQPLISKPGQSQPSTQNPNQKGIANPMPQTSAALGSLMQSHDYGDQELTRILELAGLKEDGSGGCSGAGGMGGGATTAGNIASASAPIGSLKKRYKQAEESSDKTVSGKIDPKGSSNELAQKLADRKMKSATRHHNGIR